MERRPRRLRLFLFASAALVVILVLTGPLWLPIVGYALVRNDGPAKADIAVVLAGDYSGSRILKAAELVRQGYAPVALVSGPPDFFGMHECDFAVPFAVRHGYPAESFVPFPHDALSTRAEAVAVVAELRRRKVRTYLLVTSDYHSARASRIFRSEQHASGGGLTMRSVAASYRYFDPQSWWRTRESQKTVFFEWCKTIATALGD